MAVPIDAVTAFHNAFRVDMARIDTAALGSAQGRPGLESTVERFRFFNEVLEWHAHGEEVAIFMRSRRSPPMSRGHMTRTTEDWTPRSRS